MLLTGLHHSPVVSIPLLLPLRARELGEIIIIIATIDTQALQQGYLFYLFISILLFNIYVLLFYIIFIYFIIYFQEQPGPQTTSEDPLWRRAL